MLVRKTGEEASAQAESAQLEAAALAHLGAAESTVPGRETAATERADAAASAAALIRSLTAARQDAPGRIMAAGTILTQARAAAAGREAHLQRQAALGTLTPAGSRLAEL